MKYCSECGAPMFKVNLYVCKRCEHYSRMCDSHVSFHEMAKAAPRHASRIDGASHVYAIPVSREAGSAHVDVTRDIAIHVALCYLRGNWVDPTEPSHYYTDHECHIRNGSEGYATIANALAFAEESKKLKEAL